MMLRLPHVLVEETLAQILLGRGCPDEKAQAVAREMTRSSLEGTYTHGVNRFTRLVRNIDEGIVKVSADPQMLHAFGAIENYDGNLGLGVTNALFSMGRAIHLAREHGIGLVALRNTNHWMRAATYGIQACEAGMAAICFSNTTPNMPTWGAVDSRLGNNPLTIAFPRETGHVVVDMAMSQFSYGAMEVARLAGRQMPADAGFDTHGSLTRDPQEVIASGRVLPMGSWKGAALSFALDTLAGCLSMGRMVAGIGQLPGDEHGVSQVFIAIHFSKIAPPGHVKETLDEAAEYLLASIPQGNDARIAYPGQRAVNTRAQNLRLGIPVDERVWEEIAALRRQG